MARFPLFYGMAATAAASTAVLFPETFGALGDGAADDTEALRSTLDACLDVGEDVCSVRLNGTYLSGPLQINGSGIELVIDGTLRLLPRERYCLDRAGCSDESRSAWGHFLTNKAGIERLTIRGEGLLDGQGQAWWCDGQGEGVWCGQFARVSKHYRPHVMTFGSVTDIHIGPLRMKDPPNHFMQCSDCQGLRVDGLEASAPEWSPNSDGINFYGGHDQSIRNSIIDNGDDCISVVPSADPSSYQCQAHPETCEGGNVLIENVTCRNGHGISIGSVRHGTVRNVTFRNMTVTGGITQGQYATGGARIKCYPNGTGSVYDVLYEDIDVQGAKFPLQIQGRYCPGGDDSCPPGPTAIKVFNITFRRINGYGGDRKVADFDCDPEAPCTGIVLEDVHLRGPSWNPLPAYVRCSNASGSVSNTEPASASCLVSPAKSVEEVTIV